MVGNFNGDSVTLADGEARAKGDEYARDQAGLITLKTTHVEFIIPSHIHLSLFNDIIYIRVF